MQQAGAGFLAKRSAHVRFNKICVKNTNFFSKEGRNMVKNVAQFLKLLYNKGKWHEG